MRNSQRAQKIRNYCRLDYVRMIMKNVCENVPEMVPSYRTWKCSTDPAVAVYETLHAPTYIENILPTVEIMLKDHVDNIQWVSSVVVGFALYDSVREMESRSYASTAQT